MSQGRAITVAPVDEVLTTQERSEALDAMTREAMDLGLYDDTPADCAAALRRAHKG